MRYRFIEFEFDSNSLLLTNHGQALAIRHTEAKVLAVLLEQVDTVLNKEDILSLVWQNKIVSEQVVFQNISHLRNLFGNDAIKTFPKRGYQWQLNTEVVSTEIQSTADNQHSHNVVDVPKQSPRSIPDKKRPFWQLAVLACIIFITVGIIYSQSEFKQEKSDSVMLDSRIKLAYIPITNLDDKTSAKHEYITLEDAMFEDNNNFDFT